MSYLNADSRIEAVTVFQRGAVVQRVIDLTGEGPPREGMRVAGLPLALSDKSVLARVVGAPEPTAAVDISVHVERSATQEEQRELQDAIRSESILRARIAQCVAQRARLDEITPLPMDPAANNDEVLAARLSVIELRSMRQEELDKQIRQLELELDSVQALRVEFETKSHDSAFCKCAVIRFDRALTGAAKVQLQYVVPGCQWAPAYTVHLDDALNTAQLAMRAVVRQKTGECWENAQLKLTNAELVAYGSGLRGEPPPTGWRSPPSGAEELYSDLDAAVGEGPRADSGPDDEGPIETEGSAIRNYRCTIAIDDGYGTPELIEFDQPMINIGRGRRNDIILRNSTVSKEHARIVVEGNEISVVDLDSTEGTYVNGQRIQGSRAVNPGDRVALTAFYTLTIHGAQQSEEAFQSEPDAEFTPDDDLADVPFDDSHFEDDAGAPAPRLNIAYAETNGTANRLEIEAWEVTIGRAAGNILVLNRPDVSKRHARIYVDNGTCVIDDLGSTSGVMVNGHRITAPTYVRAEDDIFIGRFALKVESLIMPMLALPSGEAEEPETEEDALSAQSMTIASRRKPQLGIDAKWLDYGLLRMYPPDVVGRGHIQRPHELALHTENVDEKAARTVPHLIEEAVRQANDLAGGAPSRYRFVSDASTFGYVYAAEHRVDVAEDGAFHSIPLFTRSTSVTSQFVSVPLKTQDVFRRVELTNALTTPLLDGPLDVYVGGQHVLSSSLGGKSAGARIPLELGIERRVRVTRSEIKDPTPNAVEPGKSEFSHLLSVEITNGLDDAITVEVRERIPVPRFQETELTVSVGEVVPPWKPLEPDSSKSLYAWTVRVEPGVPTTLVASYSVTLPADKTLMGGVEEPQT